MATPFTETEINSAIESLIALEPTFSENAEQYTALLKQYAHLSHKQWNVTENCSNELAKLIGDVDATLFQTLFKRVLSGGNWAGAMEAKINRNKNDKNKKPWVVLVTGLNGIRKTTSIYQKFFKKLLSEAIVTPTTTTTTIVNIDDLPDGNNSFFRQLDYMLATLANNEFKGLYTDFSDKPVADYSKQKASIFKRYRMLAEMLGIYLMKTCKKHGMNVMVETSGRDVAMFKYIEHIFPENDLYNKLVLHFTINDLKHAETSVDSRMLKEMSNGKAALSSNTTDRNKIIEANAGGPYGSEVLHDVQAASDKVWESILDNSAGVGDGWHKASFLVNGNEDPNKWTICACNNEKINEEKQVYGFEPLS